MSEPVDRVNPYKQSWSVIMVFASQNLSPEQRLADAGLFLPPPLTTANLFSPTSRDGHLVYVSGHVPKLGDTFVHLGKIGAEISAEQAKPIARQLALSCLASIKAEIGELARVRRILKMIGFFVAVPEFTAHSALLNSASEVLLSAFADAGQHARSAIGVASLPHGAAMEIEMVVAVHA
jgi:enamine deaminase RidA (YjgF/YER057c/UK114 family)